MITTAERRQHFMRIWDDPSQRAGNELSVAHNPADWISRCGSHSRGYCVHLCLFLLIGNYSTSGVLIGIGEKGPNLCLLPDFRSEATGRTDVYMRTACCRFW